MTSENPLKFISDLLGQKVEKISESEIKQLVILVISDFKMF